MQRRESRHGSQRHPPSMGKSTAGGDRDRRKRPTGGPFADIEAFNGRFRTECLNVKWFLTRADATEKLEDWRKDYNEVRPHGAIGHKVPNALMNRDGATSPPS